MYQGSLATNMGVLTYTDERQHVKNGFIILLEFS